MSGPAGSDRVVKGLCLLLLVGKPRPWGLEWSLVRGSRCCGPARAGRLDRVSRCTELLSLLSVLRALVSVWL